MRTWTEIVGTVDEVGDGFITLRIAYTIRIPKDELAKYAHQLRKGSRVGILFMDDGRMRVRVLDESPTSSEGVKPQRGLRST